MKELRLIIRKYNKLILLCTGFSIVFVLILYTSAYKLAYLTTEKDERIRVENSIKLSSELPSRFYEIYNMMYPKSLEQGQFRYLINRDIKTFQNRQYQSECPCRIAARVSQWISSYRLSLPQKTFFIESFASQKECLNYVASIAHFGNDVVGVENVSIVLFNKKIDGLDDEEYIEIILMMENPSFYNRVRRPEIVKKRINEYLEKINHASKS